MKASTFKHYKIFVLIIVSFGSIFFINNAIAWTIADIKEGNSWTYKMDDESTYTWQFSGREIRKGIKYYRLEVTKEGESLPEETQLISYKKRKGVYYYSSYYSNGDYLKPSKQYLQTPKKMTMGKKYKSKVIGMYGYQDKKTLFKMSLSRIFVGYEDVSTELGEFKSCSKVITKTIRTFPKFHQKIIFIGTSYFVKGIGAIQMTYKISNYINGTLEDETDKTETLIDYQREE